MEGAIVTFGEIMLRLNPEGYYRIRQADRYEASFAGGEANVAVSLANYGEKVKFVTKLPANDVALAAVNDLRKYGIDTSLIVSGGPRIGVYFVEKGVSQRASKVIYDRAGSSAALAKITDYDWDKIFDGAVWFHFTGITPALGGENPEICMEAVKKAREKNITVSCDLNYRKKLWPKDKAREVMSRLMPYVDVCIANEEDAKDVFGISAEHTDIQSGQIDYEAYKKVAREISRKFGCKKVAITLRGSISASVNTWAGMISSGKEAYISPVYRIQIVDRVGGGDSFAGALIYGILHGFDDQKTVNYAAAASCLKHTVEHDFNQVSVDEVMDLLNGNASGRVVR